MFDDAKKKPTSPFPPDIGEFSQKVAQDIVASWPQIVYITLIGLGLSLVMVVLLR